MSRKIPTVYILASKRNGTLYIGVTSHLSQRMAQHRQGLIEGFSKRYAVKHLVYHCAFASMDDAIRRERRLIHWKRMWKLNLIEADNPEWQDLFFAESGEILSAPGVAERLAAEPVRDGGVTGSCRSAG